MLFASLLHARTHSCVRKLLHRIDFSETPGASFGPVVFFFWCFSGAVLVIFCCFSGAFLVLFAGTSFDPLLHCPAAWALLFPVLLLIRFCFFLAPCLARLCFILVLLVQTHGLPAVKSTTLPILRRGCDWCSTAGAGNSGCSHEK